MFGKRKKRREAIRNKLREKSEYKMKSENVAIPEIHTKDFDEIEEHIDEIEQEKEEKHSILYDNVAIPEVHIHKKDGSPHPTGASSAASGFPPEDPPPHPHLWKGPHFS